MATLSAKRLDSTSSSLDASREGEGSPMFRKTSDQDVPLTDLTESTLETTETTSSNSCFFHDSTNSITDSAVLEMNESSRALRRQEQPQRAHSDSDIHAARASAHSRVKKSVSWSKIMINHHAIVLGDNPSVSSGPPVALGPEVLHMDSISVLDYEASRPPRREKYQMALPRMIREDMLKNEGYGRADFRDAEEEIRRIKKHRQASAAATLWEKLRNVAKSRRLLGHLKQLESDNALIAWNGSVWYSY